MTWALLLAVSFASIQDDDALKSELPRIAATEPGRALSKFRLHDGFELKPAAVEPMVTDPVDAAYDEDGRLYVVEMRGYPYPENTPPGRVRRLEDTDGDGKFDRSTVFLDGLSWPTSVVCSDGGVYVAAPPDLIYARDADGDGVAEVSKVAFTGFGKDNVQALFNGLIWGPDGWIYGNGSSNGGTIRNVGHPEKPALELGRRDFRFRPDGSEFEAISGGGQFGHAFDDWGRRFTCSNSNHIREIVVPSWYLARNPGFNPPDTTVDIPVEGAAAPVFRISAPEPWRLVRTRQRAADPEYRRKLPPTELVATGFFTSATGVTIYRGTAFPDEYRGNAFIGDVGGNLVHRKRLEPDGAIEKAVRADEGVEFLASTDNWFRPVNFENTPWGTLLILDMYRETIEHPWSIPEPIKKHLDLTSGHDRGRLYELVPTGLARRGAPKLSQATTEKLVATLADPDAWWRETAQRLLLQRRDPKAADLLRKLVEQRPSPLGKLHALWTLAALGAIQADEVLLGLKDNEPRVRERSAVLAESLLQDEAVKQALVALSADPDAQVRFQAAFSIGQIDGPEALPALEQIARKDRADRWTRAAVMTSSTGRAAGLLAALAGNEEFQSSPDARPWLDDLATMVGGTANADEVSDILRRVSARPKDARALAISLLAGRKRTGGNVDDWMAEGRSSAPLLSGLLESASRDAESTEVDLGDRIASLELVGLANRPGAIELISGLIDAKVPAPLQLAALRALGAMNEPEVGRVVVDRWRGLAPSLRREATEVMFARTDRLRQLLQAVESGAISAADIDPVRLSALAKHEDTEVRTAAERLASKAPAKADRATVLQAYRTSLSLKGDVERGRAVFRRVCATCHQAEGVGTVVGPDLATVSAREEDNLLLHILDPNKEVLPQYMTYIIATTDGRSLSGLVAAESPTSITLKRAEGVTDVVPRDQIEEMASAGISQMPEGLEKDVDPQAMADVIAYLKGLTATEKAP